MDDIFLLWPHGMDTLETFLEDAKIPHPNISFTHEYSTTAVSIFDVIIKINNRIIATSIHAQNTDSHLYVIAPSVILCRNFFLLLFA